MREQAARLKTRLMQIGGEEHVRDYEMRRQLIEEGVQRTLQTDYVGGGTRGITLHANTDPEHLAIEILINPALKVVLKVRFSCVLLLFNESDKKLQGEELTDVFTNHVLRSFVHEDVCNKVREDMGMHPPVYDSLVDLLKVHRESFKVRMGWNWLCLPLT